MSRHDIQALRAIAAGSVVLFHLWPDWLPGGYVGVDVFFVISGYLIGGHLLREISDSGGIQLSAFWARRAKRLLPAALTVLFITTIATVLFVPASKWEQFLHEIIASTLYVENWLLAANSVDYLAADNAASPVQHYWTLSVEEQFYLVVPILLLLMVKGATVIGWPWRRLVTLVVPTVVVAGFLYSIWRTSDAPPIAYFSTLTRAWEFGLGVFFALLPGLRRRGPGRLFAWTGAAMICISFFVFGSDTAFPGYAAALPVVGAALVIHARDVGRGFSFARLGQVPPVRFLGRVSYSTYLWHWPLIILLPFAIGRELTNLDKAAVLVGTLFLAQLTARYVEDPIRFSEPLLHGRRAPRLVAVASAAGMLVVAGTAGAAVGIDERRLSEEQRLTRTIVSDLPACLGAQAMDPALAPCDNPDLADTLVPDPSSAPRDDVNRGECWVPIDQPDFRHCTIGPGTGYSKRIFAVGDSHNNAMLSAYEVIADQRNWQIEVAGHSGCHWTNAEQTSLLEAYVAPCNAWKAHLRDYLATEAPFDAVLTTNVYTRTLVRADSGRTVEETTVDGLQAAWQPVIARGTPVLALRDVPEMREDVIACLEAAGASGAVACARPRDVALAAFDSLAAAVAVTPGSALIDLTDFFCDDESCYPIIGNVVAYRDPDHVTATFARTLGIYLGAEIADAAGW